MTSLIILTVGAGTAGKHSNLAPGLINTLIQAQPRLSWLVPSTSPDLVELAKLVRDGAPMPAAFHSWDVNSTFRCSAAPDDIFDCRAALREVLAAARQQLRKISSASHSPTTRAKVRLFPP